MSNRIYYVMLIFTVMVFAVSCNGNKEGNGNKNVADLTRQLSYADNIKDFINEVEVSEINLDEMKADTLRPVQIIGEEELNKNKNKIFLISAVDCAIARDSIYIVDLRQKCVVVADKNGKLVRRIGREGKGPGEFMLPTCIANNQNYFAISDAQQWTTSIYDNRFNFLRTVKSGDRTTDKNIGFSEKYLYCKTSLFRKETNLDVFSLGKKSLGKLVTTIKFPMLVKPQQKDTPMNASTFAVNDSGYIFYSYIGMPWLFIYNPIHKHIASIKFNADFIVKSLKSIKIPRGKQSNFALKQVIKSIYVQKKDIFILFNTEYLLKFTLNSSNKPVNEKLFKLLLIGANEKKTIKKITIENKNIFASSWFSPFIIKYNFK